MPDLLTLLLQIAVILVLARLIGWLFRKIQQPQVIGEMVAGILLGPSLLGWLAPGVSATLFPPESLGYLNALSLIGLLIFMFLVGLELDAGVLRGQGRAMFLTSQAGIVAPFVLGALLAVYLYPRLAADGVPFGNFALFMGAAMSITAFPVLARILIERGLIKTKLGSVAIACAAVGDVQGWCILAGVVVLARAGHAAVPLWITLLGSLAYVLVMWYVVRPVAHKFEIAFRHRHAVTQDMMALIFVFILASAWITEWLGVHALFGAFMVGAVMPRDHHFTAALTEKLEHMAVVLLLPIFFAFNGLRTSIGLVNGAQVWFYCALIILVAIVGKFGGVTAVARATGISWREASSLGILMNTRGLMELVILNIGLDIGVISPTVFTMMVIMAVVTTFTTSPLLQWVYYARLWPGRVAEGVAERVL